MPPPVAPQLPLDKVFHALFYIPLGGLIFLALGGAGARPARVWAAAALLAGAYGLGLEVVQYFLPWRSFEWLDAGMDLVGATAGAVGVALVGIYLRPAKTVPPA